MRSACCMIGLTALLALTLGASAPAAAADAANAVNQIKIDNFTFTPATLTVAAGATVTWVNRDDIPHTVVSTDKSWKSKALDTDETFSRVFAKPGRYPYFCSLHPKMTGEVVVR
jgi:plastocyanin